MMTEELENKEKQYNFFELKEKCYNSFRIVSRHSGLRANSNDFNQSALPEDIDEISIRLFLIDDLLMKKACGSEYGFPTPDQKLTKDDVKECFAGLSWHINTTENMFGDEKVKNDPTLGVKTLERAIEIVNDPALRSTQRITRQQAESLNEGESPKVIDDNNEFNLEHSEHTTDNNLDVAAANLQEILDFISLD
ncbi:MAG: hypothetical protein ACRBDI_10340 [Alphaproteobacteria bacterium]